MRIDGRQAKASRVLCGNDVLAFGALLEARRMGVKLPAELSIVGFDDLELARHIHPALMTVCVPAEEMWRIAAERLIAMLRGDQVARATEIEAAPVVRESTGPAPREKAAR